jgi:hypothetical protein
VWWYLADVLHSALFAACHLASFLCPQQDQLAKAMVGKSTSKLTETKSLKQQKKLVCPTLVPPTARAPSCLAALASSPAF